VPERRVFKSRFSRAKTDWRATHDVSIGWRAFACGRRTPSASIQKPGDTLDRSIALARCTDARSPFETTSANFDQESEASLMR
jgi:hypothetical protein